MLVNGEYKIQGQQEIYIPKINQVSKGSNQNNIRWSSKFARRATCFFSTFVISSQSNGNKDKFLNYLSFVYYFIPVWLATAEFVFILNRCTSSHNYYIYIINWIKDITDILLNYYSFWCFSKYYLIMIKTASLYSLCTIDKNISGWILADWPCH